MIDKAFVQRMAGYNAWQNANVYRCTDRLSDQDRKRDRGAFFGSIHATLNHLLWADRMWMHRFTGTEKPAGGIPASVGVYADWRQLRREREAFDNVIIGWAENLDTQWLEGELTWYSGNTGREVTRPKWVLVTHMFNHQTHHRGQVHCMLTQCWIKPDPTDLPYLAALAGERGSWVGAGRESPGYSVSNPLSAKSLKPPPL
jgi:uncharacterized damage-inducible protein DinB